MTDSPLVTVIVMVAMMIMMMILIMCLADYLLVCAYCNCLSDYLFNGLSPSSGGDYSVDIDDDDDKDNEGGDDDVDDGFIWNLLGCPGAQMFCFTMN